MAKNQLFIIGAPKSGTSTLANWLNQHPLFTLPEIKEPRYFTDFYDKAWSGPDAAGFVENMVGAFEDYEDLYETTGEAQWGIDASSDYLWCECSAEKIRKYLDHKPGKVIAILRDPVSRAASEYGHTVRDNLEHVTFEESLHLEVERFEAQWQPLFYHKLRSSYFDQVGRYLNLFDRADFLILPFESLQQPTEALRTICNFLDIEQVEIRDTSVSNASFKRRFPFIEEFRRSDSPAKRVLRPLAPSRLRAKLSKSLEGWNRAPIKIPIKELRFAKSLLNEDIERCKRELPIDTRNWGASI